MEKFNLLYKPLGESAILVEWPQVISKNILNNIRLFVSKIENKKIKEVLELNFVYSSLLVIYDSLNSNQNELINKLKFIYNEDFVHDDFNKTVWEIPVCYDEEFGVDLECLSLKKEMRKDEIIQMHSKAIYTVYGIGFLPGFLYLGGLSKKLHFPRRNTPRMLVPKGAVAIGGSQTGIYPQNSPGGWHIIGRTPVSLFNINSDMPCEILASDEISFKAISKSEFESIEIQQERGVYELKKWKHND